MTDAGRLVYKTELDTSGYQKGINDIQSKTKTGGAGIKSIVAGLGITKLVSKAFDVIKNSMDGAISRLDTMRNFPKVMENLGISSKESEKAINRLSEGLQGIPTTLDAGALAVQRFTSKNGDVQKSVDLFLAVNDAILAGGANSQIQESALEQLSQAYAKGKMDMMEWRTIQMAMPAQLKQVATVMGYTTEELGEMMRQGDNTAETMDKFIETIVEMDKKGVKGFKSLKEQSRNATGGIQTNITNMKTAIVRGVAKMIEQFDLAMSKKGLGGLGDNITKVGKTAEKILTSLGQKLPTVINILLKVINVLSKLAPLILTIVTAITTYKVAMGIATTATNLFTAALSANPIGLAIAGIVALTTAIIAFSGEVGKADKKTQEINDSLKSYETTMKDIDKRRQENLNTSMQEIYGYQSLYEELQTLVDENGKVKEGYEERAKVIAEQLSSALGTEITMTDNVIQNYQGLQDEINQTIEYKKALAYFNAHEEEYNEAVKKKTERQNDYNKALDNSNKKQDAYNEKVKEASKEYGVAEEVIIAYMDGTIKLTDLKGKERVAISNMFDPMSRYNKQLTETKENMDKANKALKNAEKLYAENNEAIYNYNTAQQALADKNYDVVYKIYDDTVTFNGKTQEANNKKYEESKQAQLSYLDYLRNNKDKYNEDFIKSEETRINKELEMSDKEREESNKKLEEKNKKLSATTLTGINDQLKILKDHKYEFRDAGGGNVDLYIDGIAQKTPIALETATKFVNTIVKGIKDKKMDAKTAGEYLIEGLKLGIANPSKQNEIFSLTSTFAKKILTRLQTGLQEQSPSKASKKYGEWLLEGLNIGIDNEKDNVLNNIDEFSNNIVDRMASAVNMQTGEMAFSGTSGTVNQIITASGTTTVINENKLLLDGDVVYENQKKVSARRDLQTQFGGAYSVSN